MLGINRLFVAEREQGGFDAFLLAPVDRIGAAGGEGDGAVPVPRRARGDRGAGVRAAAARARRSGRRCPGLIAILALGDVALAVIGTLVSAIAVQTRARDLIGPIIGLPLLLPALIGMARGVGPLLARTRLGVAAGEVGGDPGSL